MIFTAARLRKLVTSITNCERIVYLGKGKKKVGNFPNPPPLPKLGKIYFLFDIWWSKKHFCAKKFNFFKPFPIFFMVGTPSFGGRCH